MHVSSAYRPKSAHAGDPLSCYLREISAYPLLSCAEEIELSERSRAGVSSATERLVCANLRFVVSVAKKFQNQGVQLADLINEGNLGLVRAADRFDGARGVRFISFAGWWIRRAIFQALADHGRAVRVPLGRAVAFRRIRRRANEMQQDLGRDPTQREIAAEMNISEGELEASMCIARHAISLDTPVAFDGSDKLLDRIALERNEQDEEQLSEAAMSTSVEWAMGHLRARDAQVLRLHFGVGGSDPMTLEAIGASLGISRERVRQIRERALSRLRKSAQAPVLASLRGR